MNKELVIKHREALTKFDNAALLKRGCSVKNRCGDGALNCHDCPRNIAYKVAEKEVAVVSEKIKKMNEAIIAKNDSIAADARMNRIIAKEEKEMAKLTIEQYKPLAEQGMKPKEIAETLGVKAQDVYSAKSEFKKAGLIEDTKKATAPTAAPKKQVTEDVPVVTTVKPMQDFEKLFIEEKAKHDKLKEIVAEYQTSAKLSNEAVDQLKKERSQLKTDIKDLQEIANGYEQHAEELNEQLIAEREEIERLRERLKQQPQTKVEDATVIERLTSERDELERENDELAADYNMIKAKYERLKSFAKPIVTEFVESL